MNNCVTSKPKTFKILHQNIASILSKTEILELTLLELRDINKEPDILCLSETFMRAGNEKYLKLNNYTVAAAFSRDTQRGGTCILAKQGIIYNELSHIKKYSSQKSFEACGVEVPQHKLLIVCLYRTPKSDPNIFLDKLDQFMCETVKKYGSSTKIIIAGDFNINTFKQGKVTNYLTDLCNNHNLQMHVKVPTRKDSCIPYTK